MQTLAHTFCKTTLSALLATLAVTAAHALTATTLYRFCTQDECADGAQPDDVTVDSSGNIYGTTYIGGTRTSQARYGAGLVYMISPAGAYQVIYNFCSQENCIDGQNPFREKLILDSSGNLYGTTSRGGNYNGGAVFKLSHTGGSWQESVVYSFCALGECADGGMPRAGLSYVGASQGSLYDGVSPLFGTTSAGGSPQAGIVYELIPRKAVPWPEKALHTFCLKDTCSDGQQPDTALTIDNAGNMFGTAEGGGKDGSGVVYELSPVEEDRFHFNVAHKFCKEKNCQDGQYPDAGLALDESGNLFGTTTAGGDASDGVLFELSPVAGRWHFKELASFDGANGRIPISTPVLDSSGNLFGMTYRGGEQDGGTVYEFDGDLHNIYNICKTSSCSAGKWTMGDLIETSSGDLIGTAEVGGVHQGGTVFRLVP